VRPDFCRASIIFVAIVPGIDRSAYFYTLFYDAIVLIFRDILSAWTGMPRVYPILPLSRRFIIW